MCLAASFSLVLLLTHAQIDLVLDIMDTLLSKGGLRIVDPAMADHGKLYKGFDEEFVKSAIIHEIERRQQQ